jgi:hypothetical protein
MPDRDPRTAAVSGAAHPRPHNPPLALRIGEIEVRAPRRKPRGTWFYLGMALVAALAVVTGFFPTFLRPVAVGEYTGTALTHAHAAMFFGWMVLFVAQPALVRLGRVPVHRALGYAGAALAVGMVLIGVAVGIAAAARGVAAGDVDARPFLLITLTDMLLFAVLVGCAVALRRRAQPHRRLMLLATTALMPAAFGRFFFFGLGIEHPLAMHLSVLLFPAAGILHDLWTRGRVHQAYLWGGGLIATVYALRLLGAGSAAWLAVADRILGTGAAIVPQI